MARPRKPSALHVLQGTDRKDRANPAEPHPDLLAPDAAPPARLTPQGKRAWNELRPLLGSMKVLTTADPAALALLCDALSEYLVARAVIRRLGQTYEAKDRIYARPEVVIASDAWRRAKLMLTEFGLTPASRAKV